MSASSLLAWILDINRLIEIEYIDWLTNLRIIFNFKKLRNILYQIILMLTIHPIHSQWAVLDEWMDNDNKDTCYAWAHVHCQWDTLIHLQVLWGDRSYTVHMMHDGQSVYDHYLIMIKKIKELERLDMIMHKKLLMDLILRYLISLYG